MIHRPLGFVDALLLQDMFYGSGEVGDRFLRVVSVLFVTPLFSYFVTGVGLSLFF